MFRKLLIVLALAGLVGGCISDSMNPLPPSSKGDSRLVGSWSGAEAKNFLKISRGTGPWLIMAIYEMSGKPAGTTLKATTTKLNGNDYISVIEVEVDGAPVGKDARYMIVRYELSDKNTLNFFAMGKDKVAADITEGRVAGEVSGFKEATADNIFAGTEGTAMITASSADLARYVSESNSRELFSIDVDPLIRR